MFFHCSPVYVVKSLYFPNYEAFASQIIRIRSEPTEDKFGAIGKWKAIFITGSFVEDNFLKFNEDLNLLEYSYKIKGLVEKKNEWIKTDYCIWIFGYNKERREVEGYHVCYSEKYEPFRIRIPNIEILSATPEPRVILEEIIYDKDFNKESIRNLGDHPFINERINDIMDKMTKDAAMIFKDISRRYPCYMEPLRQGILDKDGFRYCFLNQK